MDSPAPFLILLTLVGGLAYQLFFRYDHWTGGEQNQITYERDNLTGQTHLIKPGERIDFVKRLLGDRNWTAAAPEQSQETVPTPANPDSRQTAQKASPALGASEDEPMLLSMIADPQGGARDVQASEDLNKDGASEQIIQTQTAGDGLTDISVVSGGRELFYGRGKKLLVLPSKRAGWSDLALNVGPNQHLLFRYNPAVEGYEAQSEAQ
jgi:hypothetical protein